MTQTGPARGASTAPGDDFAEFVTAHWARLRQVAWLLARDPDDAEDLLQAVLERACASWPRVREGDPYAYVRRALVNRHIDQWRRRRLLEALPLPRHRDDRAGSGPGAEDVVADRAELSELLGRLTARERAIVVLRYYLDLSTADVAEELGVSTGTVKSTLSRALASLRVDPDPAPGSHADTHADPEAHR